MGTKIFRNKAHHKSKCPKISGIIKRIITRFIRGMSITEFEAFKPEYEEFSAKISNEFKRYSHGCKKWQYVFATNFRAYTSETARANNCKVGRLHGVIATRNGPGFYIEGDRAYYWSVLPATKEDYLNWKYPQGWNHEHPEWYI